MSHTLEKRAVLAYPDYFRIAHGKNHSITFIIISGLFMTISWGIFIVTGVLFARHFRGYETVYCGVKMWFSVRPVLFFLRKNCSDASSPQHGRARWCIYGNNLYYCIREKVDRPPDTLYGIVAAIAAINVNLRA